MLAAAYRQNLLRVAGRCPVLSADAINSYLRARVTAVSRTTVRNERAMLLILWRWAWEEGRVDVAPRGVASIRASRPPTRAWSLVAVRSSVNRASEKNGRLTRKGADLGVFLQCWLLLGYETGARWGDLWSLGSTHLEGDVLRFGQSKTGTPLFRRLSPACVAAVEKMLACSPDGRILGWVCNKRRAMRLMKAHLQECGMPGTSKWLRRSVCTHLEIQERGRGKRFLAHKSDGMADKHYIDWSQIPSEMPMAPTLIGHD